ncbi:hypothetical protein B0H21DRAFT_530055 [Amylocystis lapponica]|nr:hypothetical protein B0H21DRAFT_530055 [Amylocystis lapponica]
MSSPDHILPAYSVFSLTEFLHSFPNDHPLQIALRTYALSLSLSLGPSLVSFFVSAKARAGNAARLAYVLKRELGLTGFACAMAVGVGGGAALRRLWDMLPAGDDVEDENALQKIRISVKESLQMWLRSFQGTQRTFLSNALSSFLAISLLHSRTRDRLPVPRSKAHIVTPPVIEHASRPLLTLDLTLLLLVRALDSIVQTGIKRFVQTRDTVVDQQAKSKIERKMRWLRTNIDALIFWACSARVMWCFFYEPQRLPQSYNKWIMTLANIDPRILSALRAIRSGEWSYRSHHSAHPDLVSSLSKDLGYPSAWGDTSLLPAYGGKQADAAWKALGVPGRQGIGGIPCELVHGGVTGGSCTANAGIRGAQAFAEALALYLPVHILPVLLARPRTLLQLPRLVGTLAGVLRSASFLSTFVASIWLAVCCTRTLVLARLFPWVSHDVWDGPHGCTLAGSLVCGASIWLEHGRRRGEMALYVLPRAIRACLPEWLVRSGSKTVRYGERLTFVLSLATLLSAAVHRPDSLRGLSRWTVAFVMNGPNVGFWKRKPPAVLPPPTRPEPPAADPH